MERSEQLNELAKALAEAQAEFTAIPKGSNNPFFQSKYAGLPAVVEAASPILNKHGLSVSQFIGHDGTSDTLTTWLLHSSGQFIAESMHLRPVKNDPQSQGSATTYARRYSYMAVLGLVADDDDDGNAASKPQPRQQQRTESKPRSGAASQAKRGQQPQGGDSHTTNLQPLMLSELSGDLRPQFMQWLNQEHKGTALTAVPKDKVPVIEAAIQMFATGEVQQ